MAKYPPGPSNGLVGKSHYLELQRDLLGFVQKLQRNYGDCVSYRIGPLRFYQFTHPEQVSELLVKQAPALRKLRMVKYYFQRWMGQGLLLNEGLPWREQRRKVRWALQQLDLHEAAAATVAETQRLLPRQVTGEIDLAALMDRLAYALNVRTLLGEDTDAALDPLYDAANVLHATGIRELTGWSIIPDWAPTQQKRQMKAAMRTHDEVLLTLAARRRSTQNTDRDLLGRLLTARDLKGGTAGMTDRQARDEAVNLLMGGKETVSATLTWAGYLLALHPEHQARAADEVSALSNPEQPTMDDLDRLPFVQQVIKEAMRLYPPVYTIAREVGHAIEVGGYRLPRGAQVHVPIYVIHRDPRWFDMPDEFRPERFDPAQENRRRQYSYLPFGAGPRACVGKELGYLQCVLVLATMLARCRISPLPAQPAPVLATDIVLHPRDGLRVQLQQLREIVPA